MSRRVYQPSGLTPNPSPKKRRWTGPRTGERTPCQTLMDPGSLAANLSFQDTGRKRPHAHGWDEAEVAAVVEYVALHHTVLEGKDWPTTHDDTFWGKCAEFVANKTGKAERTSTACRSTMNRLKKKHSTLHEAEEFYNIRYTDLGQKENHPAATTTTTSKSPATSLADIQSEFHNLTPAQQWDCLDNLFRHKLEAMRPSLPFFVPRDFLKLSAAAMNTLDTNKRENTLFHLASALGTSREDGSGPRMPVDRMPFPLIEYNAKFFHADHPDLVRCPSEYSMYMETMYAHFGKKWANMHCGPRWLGVTEEEGEVREEEEEEEGESETAEKRKDLLKLAGCKEVDLLAEAMKELGSSLGVEPLPDGDELPAEAMRDDGDSLGVDPLRAEDQLPAETSTSPLPWLEQENWAQDLYPSHLSAISPCPALTSTPIKSNSTIQGYSFLFSSASRAERRELQEGLPAEELQRIHNIRPAEQRKSRDRLKTMDAKVNVAGLSDRTLRRKIAKAPFDTNASIQVSLLSKAHASNPKGRWWIKADACDLQQGLRESMRHEWSGDTDLGDGKLQQAQEEYKAKQAFVRILGMGDRASKTQLSSDLTSLHAAVEEHKGLLEDGLKKSQDLYDKKQRENASEETRYSLGWEIDSFRTLNRINQELLSTMEEMLSTLSRGENPTGIRLLREQLQSYLKAVYMKKREAASHLLIFMISDEQRNMKPYAIPVRVLPCRVVKDAKIRALKDELKRTMEEIGMVVVGFVTDGEWNSLRTMGGDRPVSVVQLMMDAKAEAKTMTAATIRRFLTLRDNAGNPLPVVGHEAVPLEDVVWLATYMREQNVTFETAIHQLRRTHFPRVYDPIPWNPAKENESTSDCLKSIMATYIFRKKVHDLSATGIDFSHNLYVPEVSDGNEPHFDREDHGHVLKRLTQCVRTGLVPNIDMRRWVEAMHSPTTMLTYTALSGKRKQSVSDCERMFSVGVVNFFKDKGYRNEARLAEVVLNWHKATDGRGLDQQTRRKYNLDMLAFLLEDWMPYLSGVEDYAFLDVNRPIKGIQGLTREVVVALVCNIESQEHRRSMITSHNLPPEHPRAGTSDDVEAYISMLHGMLGPIFDHKTYRENQRKICHEFGKKLDNDLPFWYHTGVNERFKAKLPSFDEPSGATERLGRIREARFADPGVENPCRVQMPRRGARTVRARFHNLEEQLPPPPQA